MEIKIQCACGERYKFEVEPIHGRMPAPVNCPSCGAEGTAQANEFIRTNQTPGAPPPEDVAVAAAPAVPALPPPVPRLRINPPPTPPVPPLGSTASPPSAPPPIAPVFAPPRLTGLPPGAAAKPKSTGVKIATTLFIVLLVGFGAFRIGYRWFNRIRAAVEIAQAISDGGKGQTATDEHQNLDVEDEVMLYVAHSNHMVVVQACQDYWRDQLHKKLTVVPEADTIKDNSEYELLPAHNGYVRILGELDWPQAEYEGLAEYLSRRFGTTVFEVRNVELSGAYHFGVYQQGTRKFHAQMDVKSGNGEDQQVVTTEGNDWALTNGYTPGPEGFSAFHLDDADKITQQLGMKLWDDMQEEELKGIVVLKE